MLFDRSRSDGLSATETGSRIVFELLACKLILINRKIEDGREKPTNQEGGGKEKEKEKEKGEGN